MSLHQCFDKDIIVNHQLSILNKDNRDNNDSVCHYISVLIRVLLRTINIVYTTKIQEIIMTQCVIKSVL